MLQDLLTLAVLVAALAVIYWYRRRSRGTKLNKTSPQGQTFAHRDSPELLEAAAKRVFGDQDPAPLRSLLQTFRFAFSSEGTFIFTPPAGAAAAIAKKLYSPTEAAPAITALEQYESASGPSDTELMRVHILRAADGDAKQVPELVAEARRDFRRVIDQAQSPSVTRLLNSPKPVDISGPAFREAADRDLRLYVLWLLRYADYGGNKTVE